jgi:mercuric reductase
VEVGGRVLEGRGINVATGSRPRIPEIRSLHEAFRRGLAFTNEEFFSAGRMPSSVVFIGGGAVAVELARRWLGLA